MNVSSEPVCRAVFAIPGLLIPRAGRELWKSRLLTMRPLRMAAFNTGNREPLQASPLSSCHRQHHAQGWLRYQLQTEAKGMTGRLAEISDWCASRATPGQSQRQGT